MRPSKRLINIAWAARSIDRAAALLSGAGVVAGALLLAVVAGYTVTDITVRYLRLGSVAGTHEVVQASLGALTFLFIPYVVRVGRHVRSTMLVDRAPASVRGIVHRTAYGLAFAAFVLVAYSSWGEAFRAIETGQAYGSGGYQIPQYPTRLTITFLSMLAGLEALIAAIKGPPTEWRAATPLAEAD